MTNFRLVQIEMSADDNFKFDENSKKFSEWVENTVDKGEIAHYEQFLLFPQCFQKACFPGASKGVIVWEWVNIPCHKTLLGFNDFEKGGLLKKKKKKQWEKMIQGRSIFSFSYNMFSIFKDNFHYLYGI